MAKETAKLLERCFCLEDDAVTEISGLDASITEVSEGAVSAVITRDLARANHVIEKITDWGRTRAELPIVSRKRFRPLYVEARSLGSYAA